MYNIKANQHNTKKNGFDLLKAHNLSEETHKELHEALSEKKYFAMNLANGFVLLHQAGLDYKNHKDLYGHLIKNTTNSVILAKGFILLNQAHMTHDAYASFYDILSDQAHCAVPLAKGFILLNQNNINIEENRKLYDILIKESKYPLSFAFGLSYLKKHDLFNKTFINALINNQHNARTLAPFLVFAYKANIHFNTHPNLYCIAIKNPEKAEKLAQIFEQLINIGIIYSEETKDYFCNNLLLMNNSLSCDVFNELNKYGYTFENHKPIIDLMLSILTSDTPNRTLAMCHLSKLENYATSNVLLNIAQEGYDSQIKALKALIKIFIELPEGPLNKSAATSEVERLLALITMSDIASTCIRYNQQGHYILKVQNEPEVNLSILLQNANLTQLSLTPSADKQDNLMHDNLIESLGGIIKSLVSFDWEQITSENPIVNLLPNTQQKAVELYISKFYRKINKLFRGEPIDYDPKLLLSLKNLEDNYLIFFLLGCLLHDAVNKFPHLISETPDKNSFIKNYLAPQNTLLDRGEFLSQATINRRLNNPWFFPALTSFSAHENGSPFFQEKGTIRTKLENPPSIMPIINTSEKEVLFSHGTQILSFRSPKGFMARIVNSPLLEQPDHRWSDEALAYAHKHYLSKEYKETPSEIKINHRTIFRPNHNVTHVFRVMNAITLVLNYFKEHAKDLKFREFCNSISAKNIEWLRIAAVFSITGRESEISASEDIERYNQYRISSAKHFKLFVKKTRDINKKEIKTKLERMHHVVRYMGNPHYEQDNEDLAAINGTENETERELRKFYFRILTIAHKLDLARCYGANQFSKSMEYCLDLSEITPSQQKDLNNMIRYNIDLIKIHGSALHCEFNDRHQLVDVINHGYEDIFEETSTSLKKLYEITECVMRISKLKI